MLKQLEEGKNTVLYFYDSEQDKLVNCKAHLSSVGEQLIIFLESFPGKGKVPGGKILISFAEDQGLYLYTSTIDKIKQHGDYIQLTCNRLQLMDSQQRRRYVRVEVNMPVQLMVDTNPLSENYNPANQLFCDGEVINISGGGLHLRTKTPLPPNTLLGFYFEVPGLGQIDALAEVVRVVEKPDGFYMGLKFVGLRPELEMNLINYVNQQQLYQKKSENGTPFKAAIMALSSQEEMDIQFGLVKYQGIDLSHLQGKTSKAIIRELDFFGMKMETGLKLPLGMEVAVNLELAQEGSLKVSGMVTSVHEKENGQVLLEVQINRTPEVDKKLIWYIFRKQFKQQDF
ncbi:MAG: PilZ domain-containing protein [Clostridia bacterium]|nr:PilZ domain-containing protein [Clostridia bacterium]